MAASSSTQNPARALTRRSALTLAAVGTTTALAAPAALADGHHTHHTVPYWITRLSTH